MICSSRRVIRGYTCKCRRRWLEIYLEDPKFTLHIDCFSVHMNRFLLWFAYAIARKNDLSLQTLVIEGIWLDVAAWEVSCKRVLFWGVFPWSTIWLMTIQISLFKPICFSVEAWWAISSPSNSSAPPAWNNVLERVLFRGEASWRGTGDFFLILFLFIFLLFLLFI